MTSSETIARHLWVSMQRALPSYYRTLDWNDLTADAQSAIARAVGETLEELADSNSEASTCSRCVEMERTIVDVTTDLADTRLKHGVAQNELVRLRARLRILEGGN